MTTTTTTTTNAKQAASAGQQAAMDDNLLAMLAKVLSGRDSKGRLGWHWLWQDIAVGILQADGVAIAADSQMALAIGSVLRQRYGSAADQTAFAALFASPTVGMCKEIVGLVRQSHAVYAANPALMPVAKARKAKVRLFG